MARDTENLTVSVMLAMHRDGRIQLPPPKWAQNRPGPIVFGPDTEAPLLPPPATLDAVRPLELRTAVRYSREGRLWNEYVARYHYLGYKTLVGAQMRYTAHARDGTPLAMLGFSTAACRLAPRDRFIGWSPELREKNLPRVVDNPRFLILPWIRIPNLGSHILAIVRRQLPLDWTARYHTTPVLIETFVETPRHTGAVYRASGWTHVGTTQGRGRYDTRKRYDKPKKDIWLRPCARTGSASSTGRNYPERTGTTERLRFSAAMPCARPRPNRSAFHSLKRTSIMLVMSGASVPSSASNGGSEPPPNNLVHNSPRPRMQRLAERQPGSPAEARQLLRERRRQSVQRALPQQPRHRAQAVVLGPIVHRRPRQVKEDVRLRLERSQVRLRRQRPQRLQAVRRRPPGGTVVQALCFDCHAANLPPRVRKAARQTSVSGTRSCERGTMGRCLPARAPVRYRIARPAQGRPLPLFD